MLNSGFRQRKRFRSNESKTKIPAGLKTVTKKQVDEKQSRVIARLVKITKGIAPERKFFDTALSFINVTDTAGDIAHISAVPQDDTIAGRTGNKIRIKRIHVQTRLSYASTDALAEVFVRFAIVQDLQQVADTPPAVAQVVRAVNDPKTSMINVNTQGRFKILYWFPVLDATMVRSTNASQSSRQEYFKDCDIPVTYNGVNGTDIQKNGIYVIIWTNDGSDVVDADGVSRITYIDD